MNCKVCNLLAGDMIRHPRMLDCALYLWTAPRTLEDGRIELSIGWYNLAFENTFFMGISSTIVLKPEELSKWLLLDDPEYMSFAFRYEKSFRYSKWEKIIIAS